MADTHLTPRKPLRLWPGVVIVTLLWLIKLGVPAVISGTAAFGMMAGLIGGLVVLLWWVFFSRAPWLERLGAVGLMIVGLLITRQFLHESIATGAMGLLFPLHAVPVLSLALVVWAVAGRNLSGGPRWATMAATLLFACGGWTLLRTTGVTGEFRSDFRWRWTPTSEELLLSHEPGALLPSAESVAPESLLASERIAPDWPGFRGSQRDSCIRGVQIATDWSTSPPQELWRRPVGPGWSSFAVSGDRLFTQEQRGEEEVVSCYHLATGQPLWQHRDPVRFWESNAGAGPRGTPTLSQGRVYTLGATGVLNVLDADHGTVVWSRNAAADTGTEVPTWGFASSPLVVDELVIIATAGTLVAYDRASGEPRWTGPTGSVSYSSPHLLTIDGLTQVLLLNQDGATSVAVADGNRLWQHSWPGFTSLQPAQTADGDILITASDNGTRRLSVTHDSGGWSVEERWTSNGLKPYFNDFVIHQGHAFGFDGRILACIDLVDGQRKWKGGRYGHGQLVLLPEQDLLLVLSEQGELALVGATTDQFTEHAHFPAIKGKTWNHPVLVGDILLVRNSREMVAFRLSLAGG